jgi:N-acetylneuraminic acid mutarotase
MNVARFGPGAAALNGKMYVVGGNDTASGQDVCRDGEVFDPSAGNWSILPDMAKRRYEPAVVALNGHLYAIGGTSDSATSGEFFDPSHRPIPQNWQSITSQMGTVRSLPAAAAVNGKIYIVGGAPGPDVTSPLKSCEVFDPGADPTTGTWSSLGENMAIGRCALASVALGSKVYAIGGYDGTDYISSCEVFDTSNPNAGWADTNQPMVMARGYMAAAVLNGRIYVAGGRGQLFDGSRSILSSAEVFDPISGWAQIAGMRGPRLNFGAVMLGGKFIVAGGSISGNSIVALRSVEAYFCVGNSAQLPVDQCNAWIEFYDATHGENWLVCGSLRTDPCSCTGYRGQMNVCNYDGTTVESM